MGSSITVVTRGKDIAEKAKSGSSTGGPVLEFTMDEDKYATRTAGCASNVFYRVSVDFLSIAMNLF